MPAHLHVDLRVRGQQRAQHVQVARLHGCMQGRVAAHVWKVAHGGVVRQDELQQGLVSGGGRRDVVHTATEGMPLGTYMAGSWLRVSCGVVAQ